MLIEGCSLSVFLDECCYYCIYLFGIPLFPVLRSCNIHEFIIKVAGAGVERSVRSGVYEVVDGLLCLSKFFWIAQLRRKCLR